MPARREKRIHLSGVTPMKPIASPAALQSELSRLLAVLGKPGLSRTFVAGALSALAERVARALPYPQQDVKGSGEWAVYFETDDPKTIHRWKTRSEGQALEEAKKAQKAHGGYVTVMHKGREVSEVGPGGKVKNAMAERIAARYVASKG